MSIRTDRRRRSEGTEDIYKTFYICSAPMAALRQEFGFQIFGGEGEARPQKVVRRDESNWSVASTSED